MCEKPVCVAIERIDQCVASLGVERRLDHGGDLIIIDRSRSSWTGLIQEPVEAVRQKTPTPLSDRVLMDTELARNGFAGHAIRASEDDPAAL